MAAPRRAAAPDDDTLVELGTVTAARRALEVPPAPRRRLGKIVLAPLAALSVTGLAIGLLVLPPTEGLDGANQVALKAAPLGISRNQSREPLVVPSLTVEGVTPSPAAVETPAAVPAETSAQPLDASAAAEVDADVAPVVSETPASPPEATVAAEAPAAAVPEATAPAPEAPTPEAPAFDPSVLGEAAGARYATSSVNVRTGPGTDFDVRRTLSEGTEVTITDKEIDGWRQVILSKKAGWISGKYLTDKKPKPKATAAKASTGAKSSSGSADSSYSGAVCKKAAGIEKGLTERTRGVLRAVCAQFPGVSSYGGRRSGGGNHGSGKAIDVMVSGSYGWEIANWARANAKSLGITEVIYEQKIWTTQRASDGWRGMKSRGSASANHYDHVHLSVR